MPPVVRLAAWLHLLSEQVECHHCRVTLWFFEFHAHMSAKHFTCRLCRLRYVLAFDRALGYLFV